MSHLRVWKIISWKAIGWKPIGLMLVVLLMITGCEGVPVDPTTSGESGEERETIAEPESGESESDESGENANRWTNPVDGAVYVFVPAGEFLMGSDDGNRDTRPAHPVNVDDFWIMQTEVTNAMYIQCMEAGVCSEPDNGRYMESDLAQRPVRDVTWLQAVTYAEWAGGSLPTEAQWEKACRGTEGFLYPWGNAEPTNELANFGNYNFPNDVGSYPDGASPYGAMDMAGNVAEWTADWYASDYYETSPSNNPMGAEDGFMRTIRGGSFGDEVGRLFGCIPRYFSMQTISDYNYGLRVMRLSVP